MEIVVSIARYIDARYSQYSWPIAALRRQPEELLEVVLTVAFSIQIYDSDDYVYFYRFSMAW